MYPLIELLNNDNIEPSIRKTTLMQLNVMARDPKLNAIIHNSSGLLLMLTTIKKSLMVCLKLYQNN